MFNIVIFLAVFIMGISMYFTCYKVNIIEYDSKIKGHNILFIANTHGNEPSGKYALDNLKLILDKRPIKSGKITIINNLNKCGYYINNRYYSNIGKNYDLNRLYGKNFIVNKQVEKLVKDSNIIIDFHEGWGFIGKDKNSIGSSFTFYNFNKKTKKDLLTKINNNISIDYKKFKESVRKTIPHSLRDYISKSNKKYILVETTGQNNIQPLSIRVNQCITVISYILTLYDMI